MSHWVRLWDDMPTDPKWRVIARRCGRPLSEVMAVFLFMMTNAGGAKERGALENWNDEDVAAALDLEPAHVASIRDAMQGKTLDGERLSGWERRQPKREDNSSGRVNEHRKRQAEAAALAETQCNADETQRNAPEEKREEADAKENISSLSARAPLAEFRSGIASAYQAVGQLPPDTSYAGIWLAHGRDPEICLAVIRSILPKKPNVPLKYFDGPIADAHVQPKGEARKTGPPRSSIRNTMVAAAVELARSAQHERSGSIEILPPSAAAR